MALYEETKQLQEENNAKFSGTGVPDKTFVQAFRERADLFKGINYQGAQPLDISLTPSSAPKSWGRRLGPFYDPSVQQENFLAEQQSGWQRMGYMPLRIATKAVSEVAQLPGYLGGAIAWGLTGFDKENVNMMVDNFWQRAVKGVEDSVKDRLPIYTADVVKNGNLFKNIFSTAFWANEGADGIGFLMGFLAPGAALRYAGFGAKMAKLIKPGTAIAKAGKVGQATEELTAAGLKFAGNIDDITSTIVNTLFESAAEGGETYRNILANTGDKQRAAEGAVDVVQKNFGILGISNYIDQKWLFGKYGLVKDYAKATKGLAKGSEYNRIFSTAIGEPGKILDAMAKRTTWNQIGKLSKTVAQGFLKEGFWEEGSQFAVSKHAEEQTEDNEGFLGELTDIAQTYADNLFETDMQKSIFLGGVLGSTMAGISTIRDIKGTDKMLGNFHSLIKENNLDRYTSMSDLYEIDPETNQPKIVDGKYQVDKNKAKEQLQRQYAKYIQGKELVQLAKDGNVEAFEKLKDQRDLDYFMPFIQQQGGLDAAIYHINNLAETDMRWMKDEGVPIDVEQTKKELIDKVVKFQKLYDKVSDTHDLNINVKYKKEDKGTYDNFSGLIKSIKLGTEAGLRFHLDRVSALKNKLANYEVSTGNLVSITSDETNLTPKLIEDLKQSFKENKAALSESDILDIESTIKNIEGHVILVDRNRKRLGELYDNKVLQKEYESFKRALNKEDEVSTKSASDMVKARKANAAGLNPTLAKLYNDSVLYEGNDVRYSGQVTINYKDEEGQLNTLIAEVIEPDSSGNLILNGAVLNADGTLSYADKIYQIEGEPFVTKTPQKVLEEYKTELAKKLSELENKKVPKEDRVSTPEDKLADPNFRENITGFIVKWEADKKHQFLTSLGDKGVDNWLVSTGNQKQAQSNDDVARWYNFVNLHAGKTDEGRHIYVFKTFSFNQIGKLEPNDSIRQNLKFTVNEAGDQMTYDQIKDKDNSIANNDIKIVAYERTGRLLLVGKNGELGTTDADQMITSSLPLPNLKTKGGYERFGVNKEKLRFYKELGVTEDTATPLQKEEFDKYITKVIEDSRVAYENIRKGLISGGQLTLDINSINPGNKVTKNANDTNILLEQDLLTATGLKSTKSLYKKIHVEARKTGNDAYNTIVDRTYSGTEHGIVNGFWYLRYNNRLELIKPKTFGDTGSVNTILALLQHVAKGLDSKDNAVRNYLQTIIYSGSNSTTGEESPYQFYLDYEKGVKDFTGIVFGNSRISREDLSEGRNIEAFKAFLNTKFWNFNNKLLEQNEFVEYVVIDDKVTPKTWEFDDGGYKGFLFSNNPDHNNQTKGTVYIKPRAKEGLDLARDPQYENQSISLTKVDNKAKQATSTNLGKGVIQKTTEDEKLIGGKPWVPFGQKSPTKVEETPKTEEKLIGGKPWIPFGSQQAKPVEANGLGDQTPPKPLDTPQVKPITLTYTSDEYWDRLKEDRQSKYLKGVDGNLDKAKQNAYATYLRTLKEGNDLSRESNLYDEYERENLDLAKSWLKEKFPNIPVEIIEGLIDSKDWGRVTKQATVLLSSIAATGTAYHEGFHLFSQLVLANQTRTELYDELRRRIGKELTDKQAEEILAEEFRMYMISPESYKFDKTEVNKKSFFQKLWDLILKIFNLNKEDYNIEKVFDIINNGQFGVYAKELPDTYGRVMDRTRVKGLTDKETLVFTRDINYRFFDTLFDPESTYSDTHLLDVNTERFTEDIYEDMFNQYSDLAETKGPESFYAKILTHYEDMKKEHKRFLKQYNIDTRNVMENLREEEENEDEELDNSTYAYRDPVTVDLVELIDNPVRMLIAGLPTVVKDSKLLEDLTEYKTRSTVRFNRIMRLLNENLADLGIDFSTYATRLVKLSEKYPDLKVLIERLRIGTDNVGQSTLILRNQFVRVFAHHLSTPLMTNYKPNGVKNTFDARDQDRSRLVRTKWQNNAIAGVGYKSSMVAANKRGAYIVNTTKLQQAIQYANTFAEGSRNRLNAYLGALRGIGIAITHDANEVFDYKTVDNYVKRLSQEITNRGKINKSTREFTPENITSLKSNEVFVFGSNAEGAHGKGAALTAKQKFGAKQGQAEGLQGQSYAIITKKNWRVEKSSTLSEIGKGIQDFIIFAKNNPSKKFYVTKLGTALAGYSIPEIKNLFDIINKNSNLAIPSNVILPQEYEVRNISTLGEELLISDLFNANVVENQKETKALVTLAKKYFLNDTDLSFYNQDGNREYPINLHSHTTDTIDLLNRITYNPETDQLVYPEDAEHLMAWENGKGNLFNGSSYWKDHQRTGGHLKVVDLKGIVDQFNNKNSSRISNTTFGDYKAITFNALLHGIYIQLRSADRRRELGFMLLDKEGDPSKINYDIDQKMFKGRMRGYLKDELVTSFALLIESQNGTNAWGNDLSNYRKNARELRTFKFLYDKDLNAEDKTELLPLELFIGESGVVDNRDTVTKARDLVNKYLVTYNDYIDRSFDRYINKMAILTENSLKEDSVIKEKFTSKNESMGIYIKGIDKEILTTMGIPANPQYGFITRKQLDKMILFANYTSFIGNQEQLKYIMGDTAMWKDTTDFHKRVNGATSPKNKLADSQDLRDQMDELYSRVDGKKRTDGVDIVVVEDIISSNETLSKIYPEYDETNGTDAESYTTLDEYRDIMIRNGLWYNNHEKTYQWEMQSFVLRLLELKKTSKHPFLKNISEALFTDANGIFYKHTSGILPEMPMFNGRYLSETELGVLTIQKPQGFGHIQESTGLNTPQFFKTSTAPLFPSSIEDGSKMMNVVLSMMQEGQGILAFGSSMKGEVINTQNLFDIENNVPKGGYGSQQLKYADFGLQLDISEEEKGEVTVSTQRTRLEFIDIFNHGDLVGNKDLLPLKEEYDQLTNDIVATERQQLLNNLGLTYNETSGKYELQTGEDIAKFKQKLIASFNFALLPYNIIDGMDLSLDSSEKVFDMAVNKRKIEEVLTSLIKKNVIGRKTKGDMLVQESSVLYDQDLSFYRESGGKVLPMDVVISLPLDLIPVMKRVGGMKSLNDAIKSRNTELLGEDFFKILDIPMNRIPGQSLSSLDVGRVKYFLPYYHGSKVILPPEITTKTGSDFDVDKMTAYFHYYKVEDGKVIYHNNPKDNLEVMKNRLNEIAIQATLHPSRFDELVKPLTSKTVKSLTNEYNKKLSKSVVEQEAYETLGKQNNKWDNIVSWWYNMQKGYEFFSAKKGTAIAAVHNAANAFSQQHPIRMKAVVPLFFKGQILTPDEYYNTGFVYDSDDYTTSRNFGEFLSAFVDVVKDPFIFDLTDSNTFNTIALLNRYGNKAGIGLESIVAFMTQPVIKEYLKVRRENSPKFLSYNDRINFKDQYEETVKRIRSNTNPIDYDPNIPTIYGATVTSALNDLFNTKGTYEKDQATSFLNEKVATSGYKDFGKKELKSKEIRTDFKAQVQILDNFMTYQILAQKLVSLNLMLRPDARSSMGRHLSGIEANLSVPQEALLDLGLFNEDDFRKAIGGVRSVDGKTTYPKSLLTEFYATQLNMSGYFGDFFLIQKDPVINKFFSENIIPYFADPNKWKKKVDIDRAIIDVESDLMSFIIADSLDKKTFKEMVKFYQDTFMNDNSIPKELLALKGTVEGNVAINELEPRIAERINKTRAIAETDTISLFNKNFNVQEMDAIESDLYSLGVEPNDKNQKFIYNLILHSVFQSGFNSSAGSYMGVVPNRLFIDIAEKAISKFQNMTPEAKEIKLRSFLDQFFRNNAANTKVVPRHPWMMRGGKRTKYWFTKTYEDKKNFYKDYDYIAFNYYTHNPRSYFKAGTNPPMNIVLYRRIVGEDNIFEVISKQGEGSRIKEYYPMLTADDVDNASVIDSNRYNVRPLDVSYAEEESTFNPDLSSTDEELNEIEPLYFDASKLNGEDFKYLPDGMKNTYFKSLRSEAPLHQALRMIEEKSTNEGHIKLAKVLRSAVKTAIPLHISKEFFKIDKDTQNPEVVGFYDTIGREAYVYENLDDAGFEIATLHEAMHALTHDEIRKNPEFKKRIQKIADHAYYTILKSGKNKDIIQSGYDLFTDPDEFVAHAFTNGKFQNVLAQIEAENPELLADRSKKISVFEDFMNDLMNLIRKYFDAIFGITYEEYNNDLQVLESTLKDLIVTVEETLFKEFVPESKTSIIHEINPAIFSDKIKVINKNELAKDPSVTNFDELYPQYSYLNASEKEAFQTLVDQGKVQLACKI